MPNDPSTAVAKTRTRRPRPAALTGPAKVEAILQAAAAKQAQDVVVLDLRDVSSFTDFFIIMSGRSTTHVQALAEAIEAGLKACRVKPRNTEGLRDAVWVLADYGDVVVHIFYSETRQFYDLEGLWHDAPRLEVTL
ncbi:MAG: ribosome silencing factor [Thermodesulfobacteriota bacterium]